LGATLRCFVVLRLQGPDEPEQSMNRVSMRIGPRSVIVPAMLLAGLVTASSCGIEEGGMKDQTATLLVAVTLEDGSALPGEGDPRLPVDLGGNPTRLRVAVKALKANGAIDATFNGYVRLSVHPGGIDLIEGEDVVGRSVLLRNGVGEPHVVQVGGAYGTTRVWAEDMGYVPVDPGEDPACANGRDDDDNGLMDYPAEPGCAFANDDTETGGTYAAGVSPPVRFALPRVAEVQGLGSKTPFSNEQVEISAADPVHLVVTRVSSDGFYVTDISADLTPENSRRYTSLFAFNFNTPWGMRVCDRVTYLSGTMSEFYGYTEMGFPSFKLDRWYPDEGECLVPEPNLIVDTMLADSDVATAMLEPLEASLVRLENVRIASKFGPELVLLNSPSANASNCDFNGDNKLDFDTPNNPEMTCSTVCFNDPECSEWTSFATRGSVRMMVGASKLGIQVNTSTVTGFNAYQAKDKIAIRALTGTLRHFSGGDLNWTLETRCIDDLVYAKDCEYTATEREQLYQQAKDCIAERVADNEAAKEAKLPLPHPEVELLPVKDTCVQPRTEYDPDEETN